MSDSVFFDTTILIYAVSTDDPRATIAEALLARGGCISVQVLNEFAAVARRKLKMSWEEIEEALGAIRTLCEPPAGLTVEIHDRALKLAAQYGYHIYDSLILASAIDAGCSTVYSEDMHDGQKIGSVTIRNPFARSSRPSHLR
jgi:predicted nucleic acid-binding protein